MFFIYAISKPKVEDSSQTSAQVQAKKDAGDSDAGKDGQNKNSQSNGIRVGLLCPENPNDSENVKQVIKFEREISTA